MRPRIQRRRAEANRRRTRPRPVLGAFHQPGTQRIAFDVTQHGQEVVVLLDGEGAKASLVDMAAAVVVLMVAADMSGEQPHHVVTQVSVGGRPEGKMEMVGHQAIGEKAHGSSFSRLAQQLDEGGVIAVFEENSTSAIASVEDMVTVAAQGSSWVSWHEEDYGMGAAGKQAKSTTSPGMLVF